MLAFLQAGTIQERQVLMARKKKTETQIPVESYEHRDKQRVNNLPIGLLTPDTYPDAGRKKQYAYNPHLDPQLQWAGKVEHTSFEVPTGALPFESGNHNRVAVKIVDERGVESLTILGVG